MKKIFLIPLVSVLTIVLLSACGSSNEKIAQAQAKYRELISANNQAVEAYREIEDNSLDTELRTLSSKIEEIATYNLYDMTDEEIDMLMTTMDTLNASYSEYLKTIGQIKITEDAAVLDQVVFTLVNTTDKVFDELSLKEQGETDLVSNALDMLSGLSEGQELMGLSIYKDTDNTPWIMTLGVKAEDEEEKQEYEILINFDDIHQGDIMNIRYDEEKDEMYLERN